MQSIDDVEVSKFSDLASQWWGGDSFVLLHKINALRVEYILSNLDSSHTVGKRLTLLDIGCGGGILTESMAKLGFCVSGIDPSRESIEVANNHARTCALNIEYHCTSVDEFARLSDSTYDVVTSMEVVEHVADVRAFLSNACKLLNKGGMLFLSTLNRTFKSMLLGIAVAEYLLRWVPVGTHKWSKFVKPSELRSILLSSGVVIQNIAGINYKILDNTWRIESDGNVDVNYIISAKKL